MTVSAVCAIYSVIFLARSCDPVTAKIASLLFLAAAAVAAVIEHVGAAK